MRSIACIGTIEMRNRRARNTIRIFLAASLMLCSTLPGKAQERVEGSHERDVEGSKDHPLITRYPGSIIAEYSQEADSEFVLPLGKMNPGGKLPMSQHLKGKITHIGYDNPKGRTVLEVYRNYESSLRTAGFEILFTCATINQCGQNLFEYSPGKKEEWIAAGAVLHLSAKLSNPQGDVYVSLVVQQHVVAPAPRTYLDVVEVKPGRQASSP